MTSLTRLRFWQKRAGQLLDDRQAVDDNILVAIAQMKKEGLSNASVAGMFGTSPSGIAAKATKGEEIIVERKSRKST
ncbi:hypothetical protein [Streptomyces halobius]|uniref:HTH psq-type domain-containing protein n=1 Tax=Streptomyces halobius TaxID=2879846 RepID=A0ABY4M1N6_9ACTN|nr:hypothetical protein [Streptomyces halobius]UQA91669.1 hypothetical protein K9S39_07145 [Streptomyces halobius]